MLVVSSKSVPDSLSQLWANGCSGVRVMLFGWTGARMRMRQAVFSGPCAEIRRLGCAILVGGLYPLGEAKMNALFNAAKEVSDFMSERGWPHCIIGGLAVQCWGEPRTTMDTDISLFTGWGEEEGYVSALLGRFAPRMENAHAFAIANRILLLRSDNGTDVDIALAALPFEEEMVKRAVSHEFGSGVTLPCCTAEDLFIMKAFAARPRDWVDAESIVKRRGNLDTAYILGHLSALCEMKEDQEIMKRALALLGKAHE